MVKNKRKATSTVARRQDASSAHIVGPKVHDHDGDGSAVLAPTVVPADDPDAVPCIPCPVPPPLPPSPPRDVGLSAPHTAPAMVVTSGSRHLDAVLVEDSNVGSNDEILDEDQLDFNFSDEEGDDSPQAPVYTHTHTLIHMYLYIYSCRNHIIVRYAIKNPNIKMRRMRIHTLNNKHTNE